MNNDKITELYELLPEGSFASEEELRSYLTDESKLKEIYGFFPEGYFNTEDEYVLYFNESLKKKESSDVLYKERDVVSPELAGVSQKPFSALERPEPETPSPSVSQEGDGLEEFKANVRELKSVRESARVQEYKEKVATGAGAEMQRALTGKPFADPYYATREQTLLKDIAKQKQVAFENEGTKGLVKLSAYEEMDEADASVFASAVEELDRIQGDNSPYKRRDAMNAEIEQQMESIDVGKYPNTKDGVKAMADDIRNVMGVAAWRHGFLLNEDGSITDKSSEANTNALDEIIQKEGRPSWIKDAYYKFASGMYSFSANLLDLVGIATQAEGFETYDLMVEGNRMRAAAFRDLASRYPKAPTEYIADKDFASAAGAAVNMAIESVPNMIPMLINPEYGVYLMGAQTSVAKYREIEDLDIPQWQKVVNSAVTGINEALWEKAVTVPILLKSKKAIAELGESAVRKSIPSTATNFSRSLLQGSPQWMQEGLSELMTEFSNNAIDKVTFDPDKKLSSGLGDAFLVGAVMGKIFTLPQNAAWVNSNLKTKEQRRNYAAGIVSSLPVNIPVFSKAQASEKIVERDIEASKDKAVRTDERVEQLNVEVNNIVEGRESSPYQVESVSSEEGAKYTVEIGDKTFTYKTKKGLLNRVEKLDPANVKVIVENDAKAAEEVTSLLKAKSEEMSAKKVEPSIPTTEGEKVAQKGVQEQIDILNENRKKELDGIPRKGLKGAPKTIELAEKKINEKYDAEITKLKEQSKTKEDAIQLSNIAKELDENLSLSVTERKQTITKDIYFSLNPSIIMEGRKNNMTQGEIIADAYIKAKKDGGNPDLVERVEEVITKQNAIQERKAEEVHVGEAPADSKAMDEEVRVETPAEKEAVAAKATGEKTLAAQAEEQGVVASFNVDPLKDAQKKLGDFLSSKKGMGLSEYQWKNHVKAASKIKTAAQAQKLIDRIATQTEKATTKMMFAKEAKTDVKQAFTNWKKDNRKFYNSIPERVRKSIDKRIENVNDRNKEATIEYVNNLLTNEGYAQKVNDVQETLNKIRKRKLGEGRTVVDHLADLSIKANNRISKGTVQTLINRMDVTDIEFTEAMVDQLDKALNDVNQKVPQYGKMVQFIYDYNNTIQDLVFNRLAKKPSTEKDAAKFLSRAEKVKEKMATVRSQLENKNVNVEDVKELASTLLSMERRLRRLQETGDITEGSKEWNAVNSDMTEVADWLTESWDGLSFEARELYHQAADQVKKGIVDEIEPVNTDRKALQRFLDVAYKNIQELKTNSDARRNVDMKSLLEMQASLVGIKETGIVPVEFYNANTAIDAGIKETKVREAIATIADKLGEDALLTKRFAQLIRQGNTKFSDWYTTLMDEKLRIAETLSAPYWETLEWDRGRMADLAATESESMFIPLQKSIDKLLGETRGKRLAQNVVTKAYTTADEVKLRTIGLVAAHIREYSNAKFDPKGVMTSSTENIKNADAKKIFDEKVTKKDEKFVRNGKPINDIFYKKTKDGKILDVFASMTDMETHFNENKELYVEGLDLYEKFKRDGMRDRASLSRSKTNNKRLLKADSEAAERLSIRNDGKPLILKSREDAVRLLTKKELAVFDEMKKLLDEMSDMAQIMASMTGQEIQVVEEDYFPMLSKSSSTDVYDMMLGLNSLYEKADLQAAVSRPSYVLEKKASTTNYVDFNVANVMKDYVHRMLTSYFILPTYKAEMKALHNLSKNLKSEADAGINPIENDNLSRFVENMMIDRKGRYLAENNIVSLSNNYRGRGVIAFGHYMSIGGVMKRVRKAASMKALGTLTRPPMDFGPQQARKLIENGLRGFHVQRMLQAKKIFQYLPEGSLMERLSKDIRDRWEERGVGISSDPKALKLWEEYIGSGDKLDKMLLWTGKFESLYKELNGEEIDFRKMAENEDYRNSVITSPSYEKAVALADKYTMSMITPTTRGATRQKVLWGLIKRGNSAWSINSMLMSYNMQASQYAMVGMEEAVYGRENNTLQERIAGARKSSGVIINNLAYGYMSVLRIAGIRIAAAALQGRDDEVEKETRELKKYMTVEGVTSMLSSAILQSFATGHGMWGMNMLNILIDGLEAIAKAGDPGDRQKIQEVADFFKSFRAATALYSGIDFTDRSWNIRSFASAVAGAPGTYLYDTAEGLGHTIMLGFRDKDREVLSDPTMWGAADFINMMLGLMTLGIFFESDIDRFVDSFKRTERTPVSDVDIEESLQLEDMFYRIESSKTKKKGDPEYSQLKSGAPYIVAWKNADLAETLAAKMYGKEFKYLTKDERDNVIQAADDKGTVIETATMADVKVQEWMDTETVKKDGLEGERTYAQLQDGMDVFGSYLKDVSDLYKSIQKNRKYSTDEKIAINKALVPYTKTIEKAIWGRKEGDKVVHDDYQGVFEQGEKFYEESMKYLEKNIEDDIYRQIGQIKLEMDAMQKKY